MAVQANSIPAPKILALPQNREDVEHLVEDLIAWLDDADLEPYLAGLDGGPRDDREGGDVQDELHDADFDKEPSLGWTEMEAKSGRFCAAPIDPDLEVDDADDEPSLGAPEPSIAPPLWDAWREHGKVYDAAHPFGSQVSWARGRGDDEEAVNEDGDELDTREADGLEYGEHDDGETDSGERIPGGAYHV